jgi:hypothetical protein
MAGGLPLKRIPKRDPNNDETTNSGELSCSSPPFDRTNYTMAV